VVAHGKIRAAVETLRNGGVIAYPTEAVWGVGCEPQNRRAVERLLSMKRRDWRKGLILIASDPDQLLPYLDVPSRMAWRRATTSWPGPSTWVFPATDFCPAWISGDRDSVAVRVTAHPIARALCAAYDGPIVSTSANRSTEPPARTAAEVRRNLRNRIDFVMPGLLGGLEAPTMIRDAANGHILRR